MISATEARRLFTQPPLTEEEVEKQIREKAISDNYTCLEKTRTSQTILDKLKAQGYEIGEGTNSYIVRW